LGEDFLFIISIAASDRCVLLGSWFIVSQQIALSS